MLDNSYIFELDLVQTMQGMEGRQVRCPRRSKNHCEVCASSNLKVEYFLKLICGSWPRSSSFLLPVALLCNEASAVPYLAGESYCISQRIIVIMQKRFGDVVPELNHQDDLMQDAPMYVLDAGKSGGVSRFLNHSCEPNVFIQCVLSDHNDVTMPRIVMFAADNIHPLEVRFNVSFCAFLEYLILD